MTESFGERLKRLRESKNKTQEQIAMLLHLNRKAIAAGLTEKEYLLIKELVSVMSEKNKL